ncbi:galactokinase [Flavobacterium pallidum]|uniref:Galactokinase n=1 Tax=Flavobacterium pallidum TaxID=2172098 RepID=A0A2S1SFZ9_9FLAO|nr:galactokinase [Flavobacterium pallidum]AWI25338.1 galactokinase [Flavobacterium pallidum]
MKKKLIRNTTAGFEKEFGSMPKHIFLSPGRINIIGEHVDYNHGFVLPAAINKYICFAVSESDSDDCTLVALDLNEKFRFSLQNPVVPAAAMWPNYILGVLHQLLEMQFPVRGFNIAFSSTIPMGAGLSSSAAVECGFGFAMDSIFSLGLSKERIALIGQKAEHTFAGVHCGIMDQFASVFGKKRKVIKLDCDSLEYEYHNADFKNYALLLLDSKVKHTHLTSGYNDRRRETEQGLALVKKQFPEVRTFRDCTETQLLELRSELGEINFRRCHFVVTEIRRVLEAVDALEQADFARLGRLMSETHHGLSKEYEVSCPEIDFLVESVSSEQTVLGARMMGGGFGGCAICLVQKGSEEGIIERTTKAYQEQFGIALQAYKIKISKGTSVYKK